jgi:hypothetical protein
MAKFTNNSAGTRGVNLKNGTTVWLEPGESQDIKDAAPNQHPDFDLPKPKADTDEAAAAEAAAAE